MMRVFSVLRSGLRQFSMFRFFSLIMRSCCVSWRDVEVVDVQLFVLGEMYFK